MKKLCLFTLIFLIVTLKAELRFYREDLHFTLSESTFTVDGLYFFRNESEKDLKQLLFYPFPQDSLYGKVDTIFCKNTSRSDSAKVLRWNQMGASLQISIPAGDTTVIRIFYNHKLKGGKAEYILETTAAWGKGFEQAYYDLILPKTITLKTISYIPDDLIETDTHYKLIWRKKDFLPLKNFIIEFE
ncbi:MAG: hypothetical protein K9N09_11365 [Candidatus Cloacimonetes bacterium]|nr:hypothetical protein [Candidatus Cloacimonadota bacterium]MCF7813542.1 hypothetical protein [Candidatus Cloacimonadota bacterium]MCF7869283.1 hypothetical protein [Candidatus Cloacimonadota bacterium]MCF7884196.1 hypothetical protein [Candidatus Cloacimonadota bacterium]